MWFVVKILTFTSARWLTSFILDLTWHTDSCTSLLQRPPRSVDVASCTDPGQLKILHRLRASSSPCYHRLEGILDSLRHVGVHGPLLKWFSSYLSDRQQRVVLDGQRSPLIKISSGVPQGSILGPLLFTIYMDHICNVTLSPKTRIILYADDILLYAPITAKFSLQSDIDAISSWISSAGLSLNLSKTKFLVLSRKRCPPSLSLRVAGSSIVQVTSFKYLGVTISSNLSWRSHINNVSSKAKRQVGFLYRNFGRADSSSLLQLYKSLVLPILDYCSSVWDSHLLTDIKSLESVQSFATKIITKSWQSSAESRISSLNLQTLFNRRRRQKVQLCFRILSDHSIVPSSFFTPHPYPNLRHTNSRPLYYGPSVKSKSHLLPSSSAVSPFGTASLLIVC